MNISLIILAVIVVIAIAIIAMYNSLVRLKIRVDEAWSDIDVQLKRRYDLIPNLIETVKGYAAHEKGVFQAVTEARAKVGQIQIDPTNMTPEMFAQYQAAQGELTQALSRLLVVVENYPQLKASENFLALQSQLEGTENRIAVERHRYNEVVQEYNTAIKKFPGCILAGIFDFEERPYFQAAPGAEKAPVVKF